MRGSGIHALLVVAALGTAAVARGQDQPQQQWDRFHVGVAIGQSHLKRSLAEASEAMAQVWGDQSNDTTVGTKIAAGFRPARIVGTEIQYINFGQNEISAVRGTGGQVPVVTGGFDTTADATAWVASALLFIPERARFDFYGKIGVAKLEQSLKAHTFNIAFGSGCAISECPRTDLESAVQQSDTRPYFGIGAQIKIAPAAGVRIEYEAIDRDLGDDVTMLSIGIAWER